MLLCSSASPLPVLPPTLPAASPEHAGLAAAVGAGDQQ